MTLSRRRVVVTQRFFDDAALAYLESAGCEVVLADLPPGQADGRPDPSTPAAVLPGPRCCTACHHRVPLFLPLALPPPASPVGESTPARGSLWTRRDLLPSPPIFQSPSWAFLPGGIF